jgi:hypothetical protein
LFYYDLYNCVESCACIACLLYEMSGIDEQQQQLFRAIRLGDSAQVVYLLNRNAASLHTSHGHFTHTPLYALQVWKAGLGLAVVAVKHVVVGR